MQKIKTLKMYYNYLQIKCEIEINLLTLSYRQMLGFFIFHLLNYLLISAEGG